MEMESRFKSYLKENFIHYAKLLNQLF